MGMLSPDGRWRWDGVQWVPVPPAEPRPMPTRWVVLITAGSIAVLLLAGLGLALITSLSAQVQNAVVVFTPSP